MNRMQQLLEQFVIISESPRTQLDHYLDEGKKVIGCFPYYVPEELVYAADMIPFGIWGAAGTVNAAKAYFAPFYCTIAQMGLELSLNGSLSGLSGVIMSSMCDTLRPLTQNFQAANPNMPFMFLAHPQNRRLECGIQYTLSEYNGLKTRLEAISGVAVSDERLLESIRICNASRAARRDFVELSGKHPDVISARMRGSVLKSAYFMAKPEHTALLAELNAELSALPVCDWKGLKVVVSGIINDNANLLDIFDQYRIAIVADDVAHESRSIRVDVREGSNPLTSLAMQFSAQDYDPLLYDPELNNRPKHVIERVRESGAQGVVILMMQFCDPEEIEYPSLKKALDEAGIPSVIIGVDQQVKNFGQARTLLQTFSDVLST